MEKIISVEFFRKESQNLPFPCSSSRISYVVDAIVEHQSPLGMRPIFFLIENVFVPFDNVFIRKEHPFVGPN